MVLKDAPRKKIGALLILPILPEKVEAWRRFVQEVQETRREEWEQWRLRVGLEEMRMWTPTPRPVAAISIVLQPHTKNRPLVDPRQPFDRWLREQVLSLHGLDLAQIPQNRNWEVVME